MGLHIMTLWSKSSLTILLSSLWKLAVKKLANKCDGRRHCEDEKQDEIRRN